MSKSFEPAPQGRKVEGDLLMTIECTLPEGVTLGKTPYGMGVFATKHFKKGDVSFSNVSLSFFYRINIGACISCQQLIYRGYYVTINKPPAGSSNQIALKTPIGEFPMDVTMHTVEQPDGRYDICDEMRVDESERLRAIVRRENLCYLSGLTPPLKCIVYPM